MQQFKKGFEKDTKKLEGGKRKEKVQVATA